MTKEKLPQIQQKFRNKKIRKDLKDGDGGGAPEIGCNGSKAWGWACLGDQE